VRSTESPDRRTINAPYVERGYHPDMSSNDYMGMTPGEMTLYVRGLVQQKKRFGNEQDAAAVERHDRRQERELSDLVEDDRRRGTRSRSRDRNDISQDHQPDHGKQAYRSGRGHSHGLVPFKNPTKLTVKQLQKGMKRPSKERYSAWREEQRAAARP